MANYYMIGGDGKEYGPVEAGQLRQWVADGRANALTQVRVETGSSYTALGVVPELNGNAAQPQPASSAALPAEASLTDYFMRGGDGKEYGPVSAQQLRQWTREGRANAQTMVRAANGGPYLALGTVPELSGHSGQRPAGSSNLPLAHALAQNSTLSGGNDGEQVKRLASVLVAGSGWMKAMAILLILAGALEVFGPGIVIAWIPIWLGITLWTTVTKAQNALLLGSEAELLGALDKLRFYFKLSVIAMIAFVVLAIIAVMSFAAMVAASGIGNGMR